MLIRNSLLVRKHFFNSKIIKMKMLVYLKEDYYRYFEAELDKSACLHLMSSRCEFTCHELCNLLKIFTQSLKFLILVIFDGEDFNDMFE